MSEKSSSNRDFKRYKVSELKTILKDNGLAISGTKGNLVNRLETSNISPSKMDESISKFSPKTARSTKKRKIDQVDATVAIEEDQTPGSSSCGRKSTDNNAYELAFALAFVYQNENAEEIKKKTYADATTQEIGIEISENEFNNYMKDLNTRTNKNVDSYLTNARNKFENKIGKKVKKIYIEGKKLKTTKLIELNKDTDLTEVKADAYVELEDNSIIGVSIKQDNKCTKSNFSVEKMISEIIQDKTMSKALSDARQTVIRNAGLEEDAKKLKIKSTSSEEKEVIRGKLNNLFRPSNQNIYWENLREEIRKNNQEIANRIVRNLFPRNLGYELYEFDGSDFDRLDYDKELTITFKEYERYGKTKSGQERTAAKLFYQLKVEGKKYRVEIRFKGDIWSSSSQFQAHYTDSPDSGLAGGKTRKLRRR